jgi:hypothetical protein
MAAGPRLGLEHIHSGQRESALDSFSLRGSG